MKSVTLLLPDEALCVCLDSLRRSRCSASTCVCLSVRVQCQLPGMARTCFPQRNSQKAFILKLWLFLCCSGHFGKCSGIQEETFRDVSPPPLLQKHVLCHFVKLLFFTPLLSFNVIYFSFSTHRSPRHVKHLPTMSWWVWTCACVCVCVVRVWLCAQMRPSRKLLKTLLTSGIPFIMPWFFLELWQNHTQGALWGCCWRSKVRCYNHKSFLRFPQREILAVQLKLDTLCVLSSTVDVIRTSWWWCRQWRCWWWWLWCHEKAGFFAFQVPVSH